MHLSGQPLKDSSWAFYESDPAKTYFNGYVQINTSNTGEPGRDAGCNVAGMNTVPIRTGYQNLLIQTWRRSKLRKLNSIQIAMDILLHGSYLA